MLYLKKNCKTKTTINFCTRLKILRVLSRTNHTQIRCTPFANNQYPYNQKIRKFSQETN